MGAIVSMANVIIVTLMAQEPSPSRIPAGAGRGAQAGPGRRAQRLLRSRAALPAHSDDLRDELHLLRAGALRAPRAGWRHTAGLAGLLLFQPLGLPMVLWVVVVVLLCGTFCGPRVTGRTCTQRGRDLSAFVSGVPVSSVRFLSYCIAGLMAALVALASPQHRDGNPIGGTELMLQSIVAVVLGGRVSAAGRAGSALSSGW